MDADEAQTWRTPSLQIAGRTLIAGGFAIINVIRNPGYGVIIAERIDEFGAVQRYAFAIADGDELLGPQIGGVEIAANSHNATPVFIARKAEGRESVEWERLVSLFGGPLFSASPLDPDFRANLVKLGQNELPAGLQGRPDDLFEAYVNVALEFVMWGKVVRYGQGRRFEARPDGLVVKSDFYALYDAKAAAGGYDLSTTTTRQFADYVRDFQSRYQPFITRFNAFIVVSHSFKQGREAVFSRSRDLHAECGVPMVFLEAKVLADIIDILAAKPATRAAIPWRRVVLDVIIDPKRVEREVEAILKDRIIPDANHS